MYFKRFFTVMAFKEATVLGLNINDLLLMKIEYNEYYKELFNNCNYILKKKVQLKLNAYKQCLQ